MIQESYHKSPDRRLICVGGFAIEGHRFERALSEMRLLRHAPALERAQPQQRSVLHNLQIYHTAQCSDPRDSIYALISISSERRTLTIDYTLSTKQTFFSFAQGYISVELLISAATRHSKRSGVLASLPSWVPDWQQAVHYRSAFHEGAVNDFFSRTTSGPAHCVALGDPSLCHPRLHPHNEELLLVTGWLMAPCPQAQYCQEFRCECLACRFCRCAIRSSDGVAVVAGLTADEEGSSRRADGNRKPTRQLLLVHGCSIGFWLEPYQNAISSYQDPSYDGSPFQLTTCVALPEHVSHSRLPALLVDAIVQIVCIR